MGEETKRARLALPLRRLMEQRGRGPSNGDWKSFPKCPYCGKDSAGVFGKGSSPERFKCHHVSCPSGTGAEKGAWDEVGFLAFELGVSREAAWKTWLQEARVWEDPAVRPSSPKAKPVTPPVEPKVEEAPVEEEAEPAVAEAAPPADGPNGPENLATNTGQGAGEDLEARVSGADSAVWEYFWSRAELTTEDLEKLWRKRGLCGATCAALGFRSSSRSNEKILLEMVPVFGMERLVGAGLFARPTGVGAVAKMNLQYCGWGVVGKKALQDQKSDWDEWEWGWTHPVLIPYADGQGRILELRVHKRTQVGQTPRLYVPRRIAAIDPTTAAIVGAEDANAKEEKVIQLPGSGGVLGEPAGPARALKVSAPFAVVTEGEFKAAALWQVFGPLGVAIAALPGITMAKPLLGDVEDWLEEALGERKVAVLYDNEEKGDAKLPGYKADPKKRYNAELWARFLASRLCKEGYQAHVGGLPDAWRDEKGKADWDGGLAKIVHA